MTQEEKDLLLKDLSARLPYHVKVKIWLEDGTTEEGPLDLEHNYENVLQDAFYFGEIKNIRPYLRPMSSMTEEEIKELMNIDTKRGIFSSRHLTWYLDGEVADYLNSHHFDYRGLIEKGLALVALEEMYKTE